MSKLEEMELDCGDIGDQPVDMVFRDGKLIEVYFMWDREKVKNLKLDLSPDKIHEIEDYESLRPSRFKDEMWLAKEKAEL